MNLLHEKRRAQGYHAQVGVGLVVAGVGAAAGGAMAASATKKASAAATQQALMDNIAAQNRANEQANQARAQQAQNEQFERSRGEEQAQQARLLQEQSDAAAAERQRVLEATARQTAADEATSVQNQRVSDLTPTVQLASDVGGDNSTAKARQRRAQFRPEYSSGVTI